MNGFLLGSIFLLLCAIAFILAPVYFYRKRMASAGDESKTAQILNEQIRENNVAIFEERLKELENEKTLGDLTDENFAQLVNELESTLLSDVQNSDIQPPNSSSHSKSWRLNYAVLGFAVLFVMLGSYGVYSKLGSLDEVIYAQGMHFNDNDLSQAKQLAEQGDMNGLLQQLHSKLLQSPNNLEGWSLLARSAMNTNEFSLAAESYTQIIRLLESEKQDSAPAYGLLAQAIYYQANGVMNAEVKDTIDLAFKRDKNELNSLALLAIDDFSHNKFASAIKQWEKILSLSPDHPARTSIETGIARAQAALGIKPNPVAKKAIVSPQTAKITVEVSIAPEILSLVNAEDTVFIFARSTKPTGPPMPLAASRHQVKDLPVTIELTDQNAVAPMAKLSQVTVANIVARVSLSGQAIAQKGDFQGRLDNVPVNSGKPVKVLIDRPL